MKLYYSPGACSLAPHIVAREAGLTINLIKVNISGDHRTEEGEDYKNINPRGYVPALKFDDGSVHTEASVLVQYLADKAPGSGLLPAHGTKERLVVQEWLSFIATELHKYFSPWLWNKETAESTKKFAVDRLTLRFAELNTLLTGRSFLTGETFTVADAYAFVIVNWSNFLGIDLKPFPDLLAFMTRVQSRPKVLEALRAEGLQK